MKQDLSSVDIHFLVKELQFLIGGKIDNIYQPEKKELLLQFHVPNRGKQILRILPKAMYIAKEKAAAEKQLGFCMILRKYLENARLKEIKQLESERIVEFVFEKEESYNLFVELFSKGNAILAKTKNKEIIEVQETQVWSDRTVKQGEKYSYPKKEFNFLEITKEDLKKLLKKSEKESLVKCLAMDLGLGGLYAEEICLLAKENKNSKPSEADEKTIFEAIKELKNKKIDARIVYKDSELTDAVPFETESYKNQKQEKAESFDAALELYFSKITTKESVEAKRYKNEIEKIEKIIEQQKEQIEEAKKQEEENREKGNVVYNNYQLIKEILEEIKKARKKYSWKEIEEKLKGHKIVKEIISKDNSIVIEIK